MWPPLWRVWTWSRWFSAAEAMPKRTIGECCLPTALSVAGTTNYWRRMWSGCPFIYQIPIKQSWLIELNNMTLVFCIYYWPGSFHSVNDRGSVSHARERRAPVASNLCDESWAKEWVLFWEMTLFISCELVEEAARLSLDNKDLLFTVMYFNTYLNAKTKSIKFRDINQKYIFLMNSAFALTDPR